MGSDGLVKEDCASFAWGLMELSNPTTPLVMFKAPVHGDTDQTTPLRADMFGSQTNTIY